MYHGMVMAADFLGSDTSKSTRVQSLQIPGSDQKLSAYASHLGTDLSKVAIFNMRLWDASVSKGPRPDEKIELELPTTVKSVTVQRLTGPGAFAQENVSWGGEDWTYESGGKGEMISVDKETLPVIQGKVIVSVKATEAVIVYLQR